MRIATLRTKVIFAFQMKVMFFVTELNRVST